MHIDSQTADPTPPSSFPGDAMPLEDQSIRDMSTSRDKPLRPSCMALRPYEGVQTLRAKYQQEWVIIPLLLRSGIPHLRPS